MTPDNFSVLVGLVAGCESSLVCSVLYPYAVCLGLMAVFGWWKRCSKQIAATA
jgi:hypothetical protein